MLTLSKDKQQDMATQMCNKARDIDLCMFNVLDGVMDKEYLLDCLMLFLTKDGGFGHGLHIDNYNTNASVYQCYEALRRMDMLDIDKTCTHELFKEVTNKAFNFIYNRSTMEHNKWNPNVNSTKTFAHAQIFENTEENKALFGYHPTAAILGYTLLMCEPTKAYYKKAMKLIPQVLADFYKKGDLTKYEAISFASLLNSLKKCGEFKDELSKIEEKLVANALKNCSLEFDNENVLHPLEASLYLDNEKLNEMKDKELDHLISTIKSFGLWDHVGTWGYNKYPEEDSAMLKWIGAETVQNYYYLKKCGRVE